MAEPAAEEHSTINPLEAIAGKREEEDGLGLSTDESFRFDDELQDPGKLHTGLEGVAEVGCTRKSLAEVADYVFCHNKSVEAIDEEVEFPQYILPPEVSLVKPEKLEVRVSIPRKAKTKPKEEEVEEEKPFFSGWMMKRGNKNKGLRRRYFLLSQHYLCYFASEVDDSFDFGFIAAHKASGGKLPPPLKGYVCLNDVCALKTCTEDKADKQAFHLITPKRTWVFCPESSDMRDIWLQKFCKVFPRDAIEAEFKKYVPEEVIDPVTLNIVTFFVPGDCKVQDVIGLAFSAFKKATKGEELTDLNQEDCILKVLGKVDFLRELGRDFITYDYVQGCARELSLVKLRLFDVTAVEEPVSAKKGTSEEPVAAKKDTPEEPVAEKKGTSEVPVAEKKDTPEESVAAKKDTPEEPVAAKKGTSEEPVAAKKDTPEEPVAAKKDTPEEPVAAKKDTPEEPVAAKKGTSEEPVAEKKGTSEVPVAEKKGTSEEPVAEKKGTPEEPVAAKKGTPEEPVAAKKGTPEEPFSAKKGTSEEPVAETPEEPVAKKGTPEPVAAKEDTPEEPVAAKKGTPEPVAKKDRSEAPVTPPKRRKPKKAAQEPRKTVSKRKLAKKPRKRSKTKRILSEEGISDGVVRGPLRTMAKPPPYCLPKDKCHWPFRLQVKHITKVRPQILDVKIVHGDEVVAIIPLHLTQVKVKVALMAGGAPLRGCESETQPLPTRLGNTLDQFLPEIREYSADRDKSEFQAVGPHTSVRWHPSPWLSTELMVSDIPADARIVFQVLGISPDSVEPILLSNVALPLVDYNKLLITGEHTLKLWPNTVDCGHIPSVQNLLDPAATELTVVADSYSAPVFCCPSAPVLPADVATVVGGPAGSEEVWPVQIPCINRFQLKIERGGWMYKMGKFTGWKKRWFWLSQHNSTLAYFVSNLDLLPKGVIKLEPHMMVSLASNMNRTYDHIVGSTRKKCSTHAFKIERPGSRTFALYTESQQETREWMDAIAVCILSSKASGKAKKKKSDAVARPVSVRQFLASMTQRGICSKKDWLSAVEGDISSDRFDSVEEVVLASTRSSTENSLSGQMECPQPSLTVFSGASAGNLTPTNTGRGGKAPLMRSASTRAPTSKERPKFLKQASMSSSRRGLELSRGVGRVSRLPTHACTSQTFEKLEYIVNDPALLSAYTTVLSRAHAEENLYFWLEATKFQLVYAGCRTLNTRSLKMAPKHSWSGVSFAGGSFSSFSDTPSPGTGTPEQKTAILSATPPSGVLLSSSPNGSCDDPPTTSSSGVLMEDMVEPQTDQQRAMMEDAHQIIETYVQPPPGDPGMYTVSIEPKCIEAILECLRSGDGKEIHAEMFVSARKKVDDLMKASFVEFLRSKTFADTTPTWCQTQCVLKSPEGAEALDRMKDRFPAVPGEYLAQCLIELSLNEIATEAFVKHQFKTGRTPLGDVFKSKESTPDTRAKIGVKPLVEDRWFKFIDDSAWSAGSIVKASDAAAELGSPAFGSFGRKQSSPSSRDPPSADRPESAILVQGSANDIVSKFSQKTRLRARSVAIRRTSNFHKPGCWSPDKRSEVMYARLHQRATSEGSLGRVTESPRASPIPLKDPSSATSPSVKDKATPVVGDQVMKDLERIFRYDPLDDLTAMEKATVWKHRYICKEHPESLGKLLKAVNWCSTFQTREARRLLSQWKPFERPVDALELLDEQYGDELVREYAVLQLNKLSDSDLRFILPQLVQALKYETHHNSCLSRFLLCRAWQKPLMIGLPLFWLLEVETKAARYYFERYHLLTVVYLEHCGDRQRAFIAQQFRLWSIEGQFAKVCELIKASKKSMGLGKKQVVGYARGVLQSLQKYLPDRLTLPLDARWEMKKLIIPKCRVMDSAKLPLWLVFESGDDMSPPVAMMFKAGDDLRQDSVTLQVIQVMDRIWKSEGLDLFLSPYGCCATWHDGGMLEIVTNAETTAEIHKATGGSLGAFKDNSFAAWLRECNPLEPAYERAVEVFIRSCAGYVIATYVMGIGDRHNDNIMVKRTGHYFHIDFGHFLGNFKYQFGIRRERSAFVFTREMAHVMGGKGSPGYQKFIDLALEALHILRRHGPTLINLFTLMVPAGMPELMSCEDVTYLQNMLRLEATPEEVNASFLKELDTALNNTFKRIDNTMHILKHG